MSDLRTLVTRRRGIGVVTILALLALTMPATLAAAGPTATANDLPAATRAQLATAQRPITLSALLEPSGTPAWQTIPSWYLVGTHDHILPPTLQLSMAQRAHAHITTVAASHLSMQSKPEAVERLIVDAARI